VSTLHRLGASVLCIVLCSSGSTAVQQLASATEPAVSCAALRLSWPEDALTVGLADGVCLSLNLPWLLEYAVCWPSAPGAIQWTGCRESSSALAPLREGQPRRLGGVVENTCAVRWRCLCVSIVGRPPSLMTTRVVTLRIRAADNAAAQRGVPASAGYCGHLPGEISVCAVRLGS
jgi:hypothetical protein